ncbi:MAG TPA: YkvA family protein [Myxococcota bacterium]|nr:YkvA family protein [Myxococcota bacterium]
MRIVLDLSDKDVRYFRSCLQTVKKGNLSSDESVVLKAAADLMAQVAAAEAPEYVQDRIGRLALLVQMLEDQRWRLTGADRARVLNVLAYFVDPDDLIPDRIPGLGYLDDAIMVELVLQELKHEIEAYQKFCEFQDAGERAPEEMAQKRAQLQTRMRRNRRDDRDRRRRLRTTGVKAPVGLW